MVQPRRCKKFESSSRSNRPVVSCFSNTPQLQNLPLQRWIDKPTFRCRPSNTDRVSERRVKNSHQFNCFMLFSKDKMSSSLALVCLTLQLPIFLFFFPTVACQAHLNLVQLNFPFERLSTVFQLLVQQGVPLFQVLRVPPLLWSRSAATGTVVPNGKPPTYGISLYSIPSRD